MTPCEKLGYKVGDRFEVIDEDKNVAGWGLGTILILCKDDGTDCPGFREENKEWHHDFAYLDGIKPITRILKTGDEITQDGKKYRVTLEEIPQYEFKPGMICRVDWDKADASCAMHSDCTRVVFLGNRRAGREEIAYAVTDGSLAIGFVNTSSLRPEQPK